MEKRKSNFELLRIFLIIMVLTVHYLAGGTGGALKYTQEGTINYYMIHLIMAICIIAVNTFVIITGYFMCSKKSIKISKILKLYAMSAFYGIIIFGILLIIGKVEFNFDNIIYFIKTITDVWFLLIYSILYLLIPFINKLINSISKKNFKILLGILIFFFSIWPSVWTNTTVQDTGLGIINFIMLYLIGSYIKMYVNDKNVKNKSIIVFIVIILINSILEIALDRAIHYNFITNIIAATALFLVFKDIKLKDNKVINKLASYTFAVYVIHANSFIMNSIYREILKTTEFYNSNFLIIHMIISVLIIYVICIIIETIRRLILGKIIDKQIDKINIEIKCE